MGIHWWHTVRPQRAQNSSSLCIPYAWIFSPCIHNEFLQCDVLKSTFLQKHVHSIQEIMNSRDYILTIAFKPSQNQLTEMKM